MRWLPGDLPLRVATFAVPAFLALAIGVAVAVGSSPASLGKRHAVGASAGAGTPAPGFVASPSPSATPLPPTVTSPGLLGGGAFLSAAGTVIVGSAPILVVASTDGGRTWNSLRPPSNGSGIAVDIANPKHLIVGGSTLQVSQDGGSTWRPTRLAPGAGPFQPLLVSPFDGSVWFVVHQQRLSRTRDASASWRDLTGLPPVSNPVLTPGQTLGQFYLAIGNRVFELIDNGQTVIEQAALPQGVAVTDLAVVGGAKPGLLARGGDGSAYLLAGDKWKVTGGLSGPVAAGPNGILLVGNGGAKLGSPGEIIYSADGGATWTQGIGLPYDQSVEAITGPANAAVFFAYCYGGDVYTSTDGGRAWTLFSRALRTTAG